MKKRITPDLIASIVHSALAQRGFDLGEISSEPVSRRTSIRRGHRVKEWFFRVDGNGRPVIVCVRIADTRANALKPSLQIPEEPGRDKFHFDASGLPIHDQGAK